MPQSMFGGSIVRIDPRGVAEVLRGPDGPVMRHMIVVGERVKLATVALMGQSPHPTSTHFAQRFLGPSIVKRIVMGSEGPAVIVGSERTKTPAHVIRGNPLLVFYWPKAGQTMFLRVVHHPGSDFTHYLGDKLLQALAEVSLL